MPLRGFGDCFKLDVSTEVMPYEFYTYGNVNLCACRIQDAIDVLNTEDDKQQFFRQY